MHAPLDMNALRAGLRGRRTEVLARWLRGLERRSWTLRALQRRAVEEPSERGSLAPRLLEERCAHVLQTLERSLRLADAPALGTAEFREPVQGLAFTAGWMAGAGFSVTDALALVHALGEALGPGLDSLVEPLEVVVAEAYLSAVHQRAQDRYRDAMGRCQLVLALNTRLPCLFLVGDPDRHAVEEAVGRLMMLATMRAAPAVWVDFSGLASPGACAGDALSILFEHCAGTGVELVLSSLPSPLPERLAPPDDLLLSLHDTIPEALAAAAEPCGLAWPLDAG